MVVVKVKASPKKNFSVKRISGGTGSVLTPLPLIRQALPHESPLPESPDKLQYHTKLY